MDDIAQLKENKQAEDSLSGEEKHNETQEKPYLVKQQQLWCIYMNVNTFLKT